MNANMSSYAHTRTTSNICHESSSPLWVLRSIFLLRNAFWELQEFLKLVSGTSATLKVMMTLRMQ